MSEIITAVEEVENAILFNGTYNDSFDGYKIETSEKEILFLISNGQNCCETWGYITSEDNLADMVGETLLSVTVIDSSHNKMALEEYTDADDYEFIEVVTNKDTYQFALYNAHNGYYSHACKIIIGDEIEDFYL